MLWPRGNAVALRAVPALLALPALPALLALLALPALRALPALLALPALPALLALLAVAMPLHNSQCEGEHWHTVVTTETRHLNQGVCRDPGSSCGWQASCRH